MAKGTSIIVKTVTRWVVALIFLYGLYIIAFGHLSPGGGFAGGVILASAFVLEVLAWGKERATITFPVKVAKSLDSVGALCFLGLAAIGGLFAHAFFFNVIQDEAPGADLRLFNGGIIPLCNIAIALKVCACLFLIMIMLSVLRVVAGGSDADLVCEEEE